MCCSIGGAGIVEPMKGHPGYSAVGNGAAEVSAGRGLHDAMVDWLVDVGHVVTAGLPNWQGFVGKFLGVVLAVLWRSFHRSLFWNGFSNLFLGTQKVAIGSCMCFQANCGEIQPGFMRYY